MRVPRVLRGGCWDYGDQGNLRASGTGRSYPSSRYVSVGFRCVREDLSRVPRVLRGGSWLAGPQDYLRASGRGRYSPSLWDDLFGFRCVRGVAQ